MTESGYRNDHYLELRRQLQGLLREVTPLIPVDDVENIQEYIEADEYGIALDHLAYSLLERQAPLRRETLLRIAEAAALMSMPRADWDRLRSLVID